MSGIVVLFHGSCSNECQSCKKFDDRTGLLTDEITACDDGMISNLESKGYYCR